MLEFCVVLAVLWNLMNWLNRMVFSVRFGDPSCSRILDIVQINRQTDKTPVKKHCRWDCRLCGEWLAKFPVEIQLKYCNQTVKTVRLWLLVVTVDCRQTSVHWWLHLLAFQSLYSQWWEIVFTARRYASAVYAVIVFCLSLCPFILPSVCPSQVGVLQRWLNLESCKQCYMMVAAPNAKCHVYDCLVLFDLTSIRWPSVPDFLGQSWFLTTCPGKITILPRRPCVPFFGLVSRICPSLPISAPYANAMVAKN